MVAGFPMAMAFGKCRETMLVETCPEDCLQGVKTLEHVLFCTNCGNKLAPDAMLCSKCGNKVQQELKCSNCGRSLEPDDMFCSGCGQPTNE